MSFLFLLIAASNIFIYSIPSYYSYTDCQLCLQCESNTILSLINHAFWTVLSHIVLRYIGGESCIVSMHAGFSLTILVVALWAAEHSWLMCSKIKVHHPRPQLPLILFPRMIKNVYRPQCQISWSNVSFRKWNLISFYGNIWKLVCRIQASQTSKFPTELKLCWVIYCRSKKKWTEFTTNDCIQISNNTIIIKNVS